MHILLVHQNFPGQFRDLAPAWLARGHRLSAVGTTAPEHVCKPGMAGIAYFPYTAANPQRRGLALKRHLRQLPIDPPDLVIVHSGWGEAAPIKAVWPQVPLVVYPELWGSARALGAGFDARQAPIGPSERQAIRRHNRCTSRALQLADAIVAPTAFQRRSFPRRWQERMQLIHEGIDCEQLKPKPQASLLLPTGQLLDRGDRVITYVSRHFEPLRGLHTFLAALPPLLEADPALQVVMVGGDGPGYGPDASHPEGHLAQELDQLPTGFDHGRLHRVGPLPYGQLRELLQLSSAHVYLTYPYTLSWSLLEAMACGAAVVGNHSGPLDEVIEPGRNGLLIDFNRPAELSAVLQALLQNPPLRQQLGQTARRNVEQHYSLELALERYEQLFGQLLSHTSK